MLNNKRNLPEKILNFTASFLMVFMFAKKNVCVNYNLRYTKFKV